MTVTGISGSVDSDSKLNAPAFCRHSDGRRASDCRESSVIGSPQVRPGPVWNHCHWHACATVIRHTHTQTQTLPPALTLLPYISSPSSLSISESPVRSPTTYPRSLPSFPPSLLQSSLLTYILPSRPSLPHSLPSCISPSLPSTIAFLSLCLARKICPFLNGKICPLDNGKICPLSVGLARKICPFSSHGVKTGTFRFAASGV